MNLHHTDTPLSSRPLAPAAEAEQREAEALRRAFGSMDRQHPTRPADAEARFAARLRQEGLVRETASPQKKPRRARRLLLWGMASASVAAVVVLALLPSRLIAPEDTVPAPTAPQLAAATPAATETPAAAEPAAAEPAPETSALAARASASQSSAATASAPRKEAVNRDKVVSESPLPAVEEVIETPADTREATPAPPIAEAPAATPLPSSPRVTFTPEERRLMARAEQLRAKAELNTAELVQCSFVEARENAASLAAQQQSHRTRTATRNI